MVLIGKGVPHLKNKNTFLISDQRIRNNKFFLFKIKGLKLEHIERNYKNKKYIII